MGNQLLCSLNRSQRQLIVANGCYGGAVSVFDTTTAQAFSKPVSMVLSLPEDERLGGLAQTRHGHFLVSETYARTIGEYDAKGQRLRDFATLDDEPGYLYIDSRDRVYVACSSGVIVLSGADGKPLLKLGSAGEDTGQFGSSPSCVVVNSKREVLVADSLNCSVHMFDGEHGKYLRKFSTPFDGYGFTLPHGLALDAADNVLVVDRSSERVQVWRYDAERKCETLADEFATCINFSAALMSLAVDAQGIMYVCAQRGLYVSRLCPKETRDA